MARKTDDAGRSLFSASNHAFECVSALGVQKGDQIRAVIHRDVRFVVDGRLNVVVVRVVVLALDCEYGNSMIAHQAGGHVVLRRQWIRGAKHDIGAAVAQADSKISGLGRDVQASRDADAFQGLILNELLADDLQHLHGLIRPLDASLPQVGQFEALNI